MMTSGLDNVIIMNFNVWPFLFCVLESRQNPSGVLSGLE